MFICVYQIKLVDFVLVSQLLYDIFSLMRNKSPENILKHLDIMAIQLKSQQFSIFVRYFQASRIYSDIRSVEFDDTNIFRYSFDPFRRYEYIRIFVRLSWHPMNIFGYSFVKKNNIRYTLRGSLSFKKGWSISLSSLYMISYAFINSAWQFNYVINHFIVKPFWKFGLNITYNKVDRQLLEFIGPEGLLLSLSKSSSRSSLFQSGWLMNYLLIFILFITVYTYLL